MQVCAAVTQPRTHRFPVEIWLEIVLYVPHKKTLVQLALVDRAAQYAAEPALYRTIEISAIAGAVTILLNALLSRPYLARFVQSLHICNLQCVDEALFGLLQNLQTLRSMALSWGFTVRALLPPDIHLCAELLRWAPPTLEDLALPSEELIMRLVPIHPPSLPAMLRALPSEELRVIMGPAQIHPRPLPAMLRTLACTHTKLRVFSLTPPPLSLTCVYLMSYHPTALACLAGPLGAQLVSLRLGVAARNSGSGDPPWTLTEIRQCFPQLRFLHVDMVYVRFSLPQCSCGRSTNFGSCETTLRDTHPGST